MEHPCPASMALVLSLAVCLAAFVTSAQERETIVLDRFDTDVSITSKTVLYRDVSAWCSEDGNDGVFDFVISGGTLKRVDVDQNTTRVAAVFRVDLSEIGTNIWLEFDLLAGDVYDLDLHLGIDDGTNTGTEVVFDADTNEPVPNADVASWIQAIDDGWRYDTGAPGYTYEFGHVIITFDALHGTPLPPLPDDLSPYNLFALYINSVRDRGPTEIDNLVLTYEAPPGPYDRGTILMVR